MAAEKRPAGHSLEERFFKEGFRFSFFQIVTLLEQYHRPAARVGHQGPAGAEVLRFRPDNSLAFPTSDVVDIERIPASDDRPARYRVTTSFLGLYGTTSPLPAFYTEDTLRLDPEEDTVRAFVDLFHHRLISLFYRCWTKYRFDVQFRENGKDEFSGRMFALIGLGTPGLLERTDLPVTRLLRYAGLLTQRSRPGSALEVILSDYFEGVPIRILSFIGRWTTISKEQRLKLGKENCRLGLDATVGERVFGRNGQFRIVVGPVGYRTYLQFLPDGESYRSVEGLAALYLRDRLDFDLELQLRGEEVPPLRLTATDPARLGWTTWLVSENRQEKKGVRSLVLNESVRMLKSKYGI